MMKTYFGPAWIEFICCSRRYHIKNNSFEARCNLYDYLNFYKYTRGIEI